MFQHGEPSHGKDLGDRRVRTDWPGLAANLKRQWRPHHAPGKERVFAFSRSAIASAGILNQPFAADVLSGFDAVIHLAGETIVGRWSDTKKKKIRDSRVIGTENLSQALADAKDKPQVFICSSAVGFYGDRGEEVLTEQSEPGTGFLAGVCQEWESATRPAAEAGIRTVLMRTGSS